MEIIVANLTPQSLSCYTNQRLIKDITAVHFPIGLGIIAAVLKEAGYEFRVFDSNANGTAEEFLKIVRNDRPDIILLSGLFGDHVYSFTKDIAQQVKAVSPLSKIIIGGPMATTIPELLISKVMVDIVVKGEGECTIIELINALKVTSDLSLIKGIYFKDPSSGKVTFTGERDRIRNLDDYPFPSYASFPMQPYVDYLKKTDRCWDISASRGCYGGCHFCKVTFGRNIATYSCRSVINHMAYISQKYSINKFSFVDDNFLNIPKRINEFVDILKSQQYQFKWRFQARADRITPEMVEKMADVGLFDINFGIESGSQEMLDRYGKNLDIKKAFENLAAIKKISDIHATFIVGGPGENWDTIKQTEEFINRLELNNAKVSILTLFPGTVLYDEAVRNGIIKDEEEYCMNIGPIFDRPYVNLSNLSDEDLLKARDILLNAAAKFGTFT